MKNIMISQKMNNVPDSVIHENREKIKYYIVNNMFPNENIQFINSYVEDYPPSTILNIPVYYLGKSIQSMAEADTLVVEAGAEEARGCKIEISVAQAYGIDVYLLADDGYKRLDSLKM